MITCVVGNVGSGKTLWMVRNIFMKQNEDFYSNIVTKHLPNNILLKPEMIYKEIPIKTTKQGEVIVRYQAHLDYWKTLKRERRLNLVIDEAHQIIGIRRNKKAMAVLDWMALIRKIMGSKEYDFGNLYLLTQLDRRIDIVPKELGTRFISCKAHYIRSCKRCGYSVRENNEIPEQMFECYRCGYEKTEKHHLQIEVHCFMNFDGYLAWKYRGMNTYYDWYVVKDTELYRDLYDTYQWENLLS